MQPVTTWNETAVYVVAIQLHKNNLNIPDLIRND